MSKIERLDPTCPPDAHKVMRPPENEVKATLAVRIGNQELHTFGPADVTEVLSLFGGKPLIAGSEELITEVLAHAKEAEIEPSFLKTETDGTAYPVYADGAVGPKKPLYDLAQKPEDYAHFLNYLAEDCYIMLDSLSMLIMRSISTVYPWDRLLASDFIRQYQGAVSLLDDNLRELLYKVRYGREDASAVKDTPAQLFLKLERKLFLQYPTED